VCRFARGVLFACSKQALTARTKNARWKRVGRDSDSATTCGHCVQALKNSALCCAELACNPTRTLARTRFRTVVHERAPDQTQTNSTVKAELAGSRIHRYKR